MAARAFPAGDYEEDPLPGSPCVPRPAQHQARLGYANEERPNSRGQCKLEGDYDQEGGPAYFNRNGPACSNVSLLHPQQFSPTRRPRSVASLRPKLRRGDTRNRLGQVEHVYKMACACELSGLLYREQASGQARPQTQRIASRTPPTLRSVDLKTSVGAHTARWATSHYHTRARLALRGPRSSPSSIRTDLR